MSLHGAHHFACHAFAGRRSARPPTRREAHLWGHVAALLTAGLLVGPLAASAAPKCTVSTSGGLAFGVYDPFLSTPLDTPLAVQIRCPRGLLPRLLLSAGSSAGTTDFLPRTLRNGSEILPYNVYLDVARTVVWGDGTGGSTFLDGPTGTSTLNAFGRIPAGQDVAVGDYADSLTLTVLF